MKDRCFNNLMIISLAYAHRYIYPILICAVPILLGGEYMLLAMGVGCILFSAYNLLGYICRWKHIYCSFQSMYHERMTPNDIRWHKIKKSDIYGESAIFGIFGIGVVIFCLCTM